MKCKYTSPSKSSESAKTALTGLLLLFGCLWIAGCGTPPQVVAKKSPLSETAEQSERGTTVKGSFRAEGDFANGTSLADVLNGMTVRETIVQLLDNHAPQISLKRLSEYADKPTRDDLMVFKSRDCSFVKVLNFADMGISDSDIEGISDLRLVDLSVNGNQLRDLHALKNMQSLVRLDVSGCPIDQHGLAVIVGLRGLMNLFISATSIDDKDLEALAGMKSLRYLAIRSCPNLTAQAVRQFQSRHPLCRVTYTTVATGAGLSDVMRIKSSLIADGEYDEADLALQGLIKRWQAQSPVPYSWIIRAYRYRAYCQTNMKRSDQACQMYDKCLEICGKNMPDNPEKAQIQVEYAEMLEKLGRQNEVMTLRRSADQYWKKHPDIAAAEPIYHRNQIWLAKHH